jgi:Flp pilus assembly protein CpaB
VLTARLGTDAAERQRAWGTATEILVVARDVPAGTALTDADLAPASWPRALLPEGALPATTPGRRGGTDGVVGRVAADALVAGEVLVADRLAPEAFAHGGGVGPTGRVVALPLELPAPPLAVGDRVDLLAPRPDGTEDPADLRTAPVAVVAEGAVVVGIDETVLAVAVEGRHVEEVVAALVHTTVVPVDRADR